jgi:hypothetical protein
VAATDDHRHIYLTPVHAERADEFEAWLRTTLVPAVRKVQPESEPRQRTLRAIEDRDGVVYFAFVLEGGDSADWEIGPLLQQALGDKAAEREAEAWDRMVVGEQLGGTFRTLEF